jgi:hypothetical protein
MNIQLKDICNNNVKNMPSDDVYDIFNKFIFSNDTKLLGKMLYRYKFFSQVMDLHGDIIEIGVFKGSGIATFSKFVDIFFIANLKLKLQSHRKFEMSLKSRCT